MKLAILGTRGIPNHYGGFEQLAEKLSVGLVQRGHKVYVYCSSLHPYKQSYYEGVHLIPCFDPEDKLGTFGQFIYDLNCIRDARNKDFDVILQLGYTSSSIWASLMPRKSRLITNMDGMEWMRSKYNKPVQQFLRFAEKWAVKSSDALVADSTAIQSYLAKTYGKPASFIAYGAHLFNNPDPGVLEKYGLKPYSYNLLIARMEPENNIEMIIRGHLLSLIEQPLLVTGSIKNKFGRYLSSTYANQKIIFTGPEYDINVLNNLRYHSSIYFHGHSVGGTNPSLLEAMSSQAFIATHNNEFNKAVCGDASVYFKTPEEIAEIIRNKPADSIRTKMIERNFKLIKEQYTWEKIIHAYEQLMVTTLNDAG